MTHRYQNKLLHWIIIFSSFLLQAYLFSGNESVLIEANNVNYDFKKEIINYEGNVHATQGATELKADKMVVYYNSKHKIEKIVATGNLAKYTTLVNDNKDIVKASAKTIYYYPLSKKVMLETDAQVEYNHNLFSGPAIFYDIGKKTISSHPNTMGRSKVVLEPINQLKIKNE